MDPGPPHCQTTVRQNVWKSLTSTPWGPPGLCPLISLSYCLCTGLSLAYDITIVGLIHENNKAAQGEEFKLPGAMRTASASWPAKPKSWLLISGNWQEISQHLLSSRNRRELTSSNTRGYSCGIFTHLPWADKKHISTRQPEIRTNLYRCTVESMPADSKGLIWKDV